MFYACSNDSVPISKWKKWSNARENKFYLESNIIMDRGYSTLYEYLQRIR